MFTVKLDKRPVLFIEVKPPASFRLDSKRQEADKHMRKHFRDLHDDVLPGATNSVNPPYDCCRSQHHD
ncbi:hypothetical protein IW261DRAFT_1664482 [Armillaria novae-zelandiae]|uniref:Uncharacterized protein n=1 Tax=Armillaria novae-zelandiae TaxID=153914 RepID=A0AA39PL82_9AGAR|nr:hypothetical protein IW261DRAFT_1664482 [Armillaria novae-zelandiae]